MRIFLVAIFGLLVASCKPKETTLPIFGEREFNGKDTTYHTIAPFAFVDQDSTVITNETFKNKIYVADLNTSGFSK